jgi:hypothetical protein
VEGYAIPTPYDCAGAGAGASSAAASGAVTAAAPARGSVSESIGNW